VCWELAFIAARFPIRVIFVFAPAMSSLISPLATVAAVLLLRRVVRRAPYFQRPDLVARRAAKAQLPRWVSLAELFFAVAALVALVILFFPLETAA
jgi:hypothetical protein